MGFKMEKITELEKEEKLIGDFTLQILQFFIS